MAEVLTGLADIVRINDRNLADVEVPNFLDTSSFMQVAAAVVASHDTTHKWLQWTKPAVGFRDPNDGREVQASVDAMVSTDCKIFDSSFRVDLALAKSYRKGGQSGWLNRELARHLRASMFELESQVFQGTGFDAKGFPGLNNHATMTDLNDTRIKSNGGSTASSQTSVWFIRFGSEDVEIVVGSGGEISVGDPTIQEATGSATGTFPAIYTPVTGWYGLKIGSDVTSAYRLCNVEASLTDDDLYSCLTEFGGGREPNAIFMSRAARELLRASRTAVNPSGQPAGLPTSIEGIPIYVSDAIPNTEAVITT